MPSLPDLPTELLLEMVKHYPELYLDFDARIHGVASEQFDGNDALRALSQTCRTLRRIFVPVLWAGVHACFTQRNNPEKNRERHAQMLERRMIGIQKTRHAMCYIRSLSVSLAGVNMTNWQPMAEFVRVLGVLPQLQHLTIVLVFNEIVPVLSTACQGKVFPSILSLGVDNDNLEMILPCFPNIKTLTFYPGSGCLPILRALKGSCEHVHTLNNLILFAYNIECIRDSIPNVSRISVQQFALELLRLLENMDNLSDLRIRYREPLRVHVVHGKPLPLLEEVVATAKRVLLTSKATGRKELHIQEFTGDILRKETLIIVGEST
ncbi:hypothetical protein C8F04DRAFT_1391038 [Mycena alexandri]|uniref:F-box domain-containing protein n=1 Tax=Mycena alexandri TaxID=1745969 RepID=A0AAD6XDP7_9AGAR|nr:hypothetical protein C8F04DRAFT_1391038 [Mycena alexandri]